MRGQSTLFDLLDAGDDGGNVDGGDPAQPELEEWPESELLQAEKDLLGFYVTGHPLEPYRPLLENYGVVNSETIKSIPDRSMTRIGGIVTGANKGFSKKSGKPYAMATLEDMQGSYTLLLINETFDQYSELVETGRRLLVTGEVSLDDDTAKLFPVEIIALERAPRKLTRRVQIRIRMADSNTEKIKDLHQLLSATPGRCPVWLVFIHPAGPKIFLEVHERISVDPGLELQRAVESILGEGSYHANVNMDLPNKKQKRWAKKEKQTETA
jgi:DNA polymerase-3 subunit alpha